MMSWYLKVCWLRKLTPQYEIGCMKKKRSLMEGKRKDEAQKALHFVGAPKGTIPITNVVSKWVGGWVNLNSEHWGFFLSKARVNRLLYYLRSCWKYFIILNVIFDVIIFQCNFGIAFWATCYNSLDFHFKILLYFYYSNSPVLFRSCVHSIYYIFMCI